MWTSLLKVRYLLVVLVTIIAGVGWSLKGVHDMLGFLTAGGD